MRSFWSDPYLWVHLAGAAAVPIFLELCLVGLAASGSGLPPWFVLGVVSAAGTLPILWMQWQRPFNIFSVLILALKPSELTQTQRQILSRFKRPLARGVAVAGAAGLLAVLWQLYQLAPLANSIAARVPGGWLGGLLLASAAFLGSNLFLQVPLSVLQVLLLSDAALAATPAYPVEQIATDFTAPGFRVERILPLPADEPAAASPASLARPSETASVPLAATAPAPIRPAASPAPEATVDTGPEAAPFPETADDVVLEAGPEPDSEASGPEATSPTEPAADSTFANPFPTEPLAAAFEDSPDATVIDAEVITTSEDSLEAALPQSSVSLPADAIDTIEDEEVIEVVEVEVTAIADRSEAAEAPTTGGEETATLEEPPPDVEAAGPAAEEEWNDEFFETTSVPAPTDPINPS